MKFILSTCLFIMMGFFATAQGIVGVWVTIDDATGDPKSHVEIYEKAGKYFGKVIKLLPAATTSTCDGCEGSKNGKSLLEMDIIENILPYKDYYSYGTITDPAGGKVYKCNITRVGDKLEVRGYVGFSLLGRTQVWNKL